MVTELPIADEPQEWEEECETCRFWVYEGKPDPEHGFDDDATQGTCCRYPPTRLPDEYFSLQPITLNSDWCGEWQAQKPQAGGA